MSSESTNLHLAFCDHKAALYSVKHWHYTKSLPTPPVVKIGVWESNLFIGCVLFSRGASDSIGKPYQLQTTQVCELTRVALRRHKSAVSRIIRIAILMLKKQCPGLRLIVSYADNNQGHHGGIYQAGNWTFVGDTSPDYQYLDKNGRKWHSRQVSASGKKTQYGQLRTVVRTTDCERIKLLGKHKYLMPLDENMKCQIQSLKKPYPKRATSIDNDAVAFQVAEGGASPTVALQSISSGGEAADAKQTS